MPAVQAERSTVRTNLFDWVFQVGEENIVKAREKHEAINGLFAGIQPTVWEIHYQKLLGRAFRFGMPAVVQASETNLPLLFTSNTLDSSDINPLGFALGNYAWTVSGKHLLGVV